MNPEVPYMMSVTNLPKILDSIQKAAAPDVFHLDFLKDLGFKGSNDRGVVKLLKYLGLLDPSGRPQSSYREFMDHARAKQVLAAQMRIAFDDIFTADRQAETKSVDNLKGWFKTKTGSGDAVAQKMASTFKALSQYADFASQPTIVAPPAPAAPQESAIPVPPAATDPLAALQNKGMMGGPSEGKGAFGLVYRFEIHLPDTTNVDTYRAIFKALREELM